LNVSPGNGSRRSREGRTQDEHVNEQNDILSSKVGQQRPEIETGIWIGIEIGGWWGERDGDRSEIETDRQMEREGSNPQRIENHFVCAEG